MATQQNTVEYGWAHINTATAENTVYTSGDITITIQETGSRAFVSCILDIVVHDNEATVADDIAAVNVGASCNGGTNWTDRNLTTTLADSGEQMSYHLYADVTAEFTARFSGTSDTCRFRLQMDYSTTGNQFLNISAKVIITYTYDDTGQDTRMATARIPIESLTSRPASGTPTSVGSNQIPDLDAMFPEATAWRSICLDLWYNTAPAGTTDGTVTLDLNTTPTMTTGTYENANQSPILVRTTWDLLAAGMTTSDAHDLRFTGNTTAMGIAVGGWLTVTYEYDHSTAAAPVNSVLLALGAESGQVLTASGDATWLEFSFFVEEPTTITLLQSAVVVFLGLSTNTPTFSLLAGSQSARTYTLSQQTGQAGGAMIVHRIDSGGAQGAGMTLARGWNTILVKFYSSTTYLSGAGAYLMLNYSSGVAAGGVISHKKTIAKSIMDTQGAVAGVNRSAAGLVAIPESEYWIDSVLCDVITNNSASYGFTLKAEKQSGETPGGGHAILGHQISVQVGERYFQKVFFNATQYFKRHPGEMDAARMDIETSRDYMFLSNSNIIFGLVLWVTYHAITFDTTASLTDYAGDGSGIVVKVFREDTDEKLYEFTSAAGGDYAATKYDDVLNYYSVAREDSTHVGASDNWTS